MPCSIKSVFLNGHVSRDARLLSGTNASNPTAPSLELTTAGK